MGNNSAIDTKALVKRLEFLCSEYDAGRWRRFTETREALKQSVDAIRSQAREIERLEALNAALMECPIHEKDHPRCCLARRTEQLLGEQDELANRD